MGRCRVPDCCGLTEYDDSAQAVLCPTCGTVATQDILTEWDTQFSGSSLYFGPRTLKSLRRMGGVLVGQTSREDRDRRNTTAMHQYIFGLLNKLVCSGLAPRAHSLFDQVRVRGKYRWGKKSLLAAGACIALAMRESKKAIIMSHLASLMDVSPHSLCRMFTEVSTLLGLRVPAFDPIAFLPELHSHLKDLLSSPSCPLPQAMINMLRPLPPALVLRLATSLATLMTNLDGIDPSAPAMACALFILALEGQVATSLPSYVLLAEEISKKVTTSKDLVVCRYRKICKIVEEWMEDVPWILGADHPDNKLGKKRRKTSQRDVIAMGLKDVVQFQEDILNARKERETRNPVTLSLEVVEEEEDWERSIDISRTSMGGKRKRVDSTQPSFSSLKFLRLTRSRKARALTRLDMASLSLLSPHHPLGSDVDVKKHMIHDSKVDDIQTQILTAATFPVGVPPTRLQKLVMTRGGEMGIGDDELFEVGELEGFLRSEDEVAKLRDFFELENVHWDIRGDTSRSSPQHSEWDVADMEVWTDIVDDESVHRPDLYDATEQVLGEWRAASPSDSCVEDGDRFEIGDW